MFGAFMRIPFRFETMFTKRIKPVVLINGNKLDTFIIGISDDELPNTNILTLTES